MVKKDMNVLVAGRNSVSGQLELLDIQDGRIIIGDIAVPTNAPITGQVIIAVTGTAVRLSAVSVPLPGRSVLLTAFSGNDAVGGTYGATGLNDTVDGTGNGAIIEPDRHAVVMAADLADVWVNGVIDDIFSYSAG